jgi:hypothetical protein
MDILQTLKYIGIDDVEKYKKIYDHDITPLDIIQKQVIDIYNENNILNKALDYKSSKFFKLKKYDIRYLKFRTLKYLFNTGNIEKELVFDIINSLKDDDLETEDFSSIEEKMSNMSDDVSNLWDLNFFELYVNLKSEYNDTDEIIDFLKEKIFENKIYISTHKDGKEVSSSFIDLEKNFNK